MRLATIDIGTNTVLLLVCDVMVGQEVRALEEAATVTRLGEGVDKTGRLAPSALGRTIACLAHYAEVARRWKIERAVVVGTSAMRDAEGSDAIQQAALDLFGVSVDVLSGEQEALLSFKGALSGLPPSALESAGDVVVFDIGGGSTEVVLGPSGGARAIQYARSFNIGSVRLTERIIRSDPPTEREMASMRLAIREALNPLPTLKPHGATIGIAGTMTSLVAISKGLVAYEGARVHGESIALAEIDRIVCHLASLSLSDRVQVPGLSAGRAEVIVAGGLIALELLARLSVHSVVVSDRGVRWGLAESIAEGQYPALSHRVS